MGLSSLTFIDAGVMPTNYTRFPIAPRTAPGNGSLDGEISLNIIGYQTGNPNVIIFVVQDTAGTSSTLTLNGDDSGINLVDAISADGNPVSDYYSVDMGLNTVSGPDWTLSFNVTLRDGKTAPYKFVKGKPTEDTVTPY